jgi:putative transposase
LRSELRKFSVERPRWGYRRAHRRLRELGWEVNRKRVQRLWREEGLRVPQRKRKRRRLGESTVPAERLRAQRPNHVWAFDFQFDQTADGRALKLMNIVDEFTREALVMLVARSIDADTVVATLERLCGERGAPELLRMDNGPEMTAHTLQDWCQLSKTETVFIEPGSPWQNPFVESFHPRVRDELLDVEKFSCLAEARVVIEDWHEAYNLRRPHSSLRMRARPCSPPSGRLTASRRWPRNRRGVASSAPRPSPLATRYARAFATTAANSTSVAIRPRRALPSSPSHPPPSHSW